MSSYCNLAPAGPEIMRSRYDITIRQGIEVPNQGIEVVPNPGIEVAPSHDPEVVPNQDKILYRHDDAEKLNTSQLPLEKRRLCDPSFFRFWAWIVILAFVLLGGAIGAGVGAGLAAQRKNTPNASSDHSISSSMTTTTPSTSSQPPTTTKYTKVSTPSATACPAADGTTYSPLIPGTSQPYRINGTDLAYTIRCKTDYAGGAAFGNPSVVDLQIFSNVDSLDSCIDACATYSNQVVQATNASASCVAVGWISAQGWCYLKSGVTSSSYNNTGNLATHAVDSAIQVGL